MPQRYRRIYVQWDFEYPIVDVMAVTPHVYYDELSVMSQFIDQRPEYIKCREETKIVLIDPSKIISVDVKGIENDKVKDCPKLRPNLRTMSYPV